MGEVKDPQTFAIIGAAMEVHRVLGAGFAEGVYHEALALEFGERKIPFLSQVELPIQFKQHRLKAHYRADFLCFGEVLVELKALTQLTGADEDQVLNYLKASGHEIALLLNFGTPSIMHRRFANRWPPGTESE